MLHVEDSPNCACGSNLEDNHFLLICPLYTVARRKMITQISNICDANISCKLLLFGAENIDIESNCKIFDVVHQYIEDTNRL